MTYYRHDLAWIHHTGYSQHVARVFPGIVAILGKARLPTNALVVDVGCGSGLLAAKLDEAGYRVHGIDASPAMIELARAHAPRATFEVRALPAGAAALPSAHAIVSTGHVLAYLDTREEIAQTLAGLADALEPGGVLAIDLMTDAYGAARDTDEVHARVDDDWAIVTRFSRPTPHRYDRAITTFRRDGDCWRRSDETHRNVTFEADDALAILRGRGIEAHVQMSFGSETLPPGLVVLAATRR
ncbi:MAG TPA: class I SAM-dependent methyltransferase [Casimicrobiaceae bacterium]